MLPTDTEGWEALTEEEIKALNPSADTVRDVIRDQFGLGSKCYFMTKAASIEFILNPDRRPAILAESEAKYTERQKRGADLRSGGPMSERVLEMAKDSEYHFVQASRPDDGFTDVFSGRKGKIAYIIEDNADGERFLVQKKTALILEEVGQLTGFDPRISQKKPKPAHEAGFNTLEDVIAGADPVVTEAAVEVTEAIDQPFDSEAFNQAGFEVKEAVDNADAEAAEVTEDAEAAVDYPAEEVSAAVDVAVADVEATEAEAVDIPPFPVLPTDDAATPTEVAEVAGESKSEDEAQVDDMEHPTPTPTDESSEVESELDDILNSLPQ